MVAFVLSGGMVTLNSLRAADIQMFRTAIFLISCCSGLWLAAAQAEPLRVVLEVSPPHQVVQGEKVGGLATAVVEQMLSKAGLQPRYEVYPWARAYRIALNTPNVLIFNMARTQEREALFEWIGPVARYRFGLLKLASRRDIQISQLTDLHRYLIGAQRDDFSAQWLRDGAKQPPAQLLLQPDVVETWRMLVHGRLDLMIDDPMAIEDMLLAHQLAREDIEFVWFVPELAQTTWIALKKGSDPGLIRRLKNAHQQVVQTPAYQAVMQPPQ